MYWCRGVSNSTIYALALLLGELQLGVADLLDSNFTSDALVDDTLVATARLRGHVTLGFLRGGARRQSRETPAGSCDIRSVGQHVLHLG